MSFSLSLLELLLSIVAGAALGYERERHGRAAGFRTTTLVCFSSCLLMVVSNYGFAGTGFDTSRVAAAVVSGMGFLGAGAILRHAEHAVQGVTTAATLWCATAIGLAFGAGGRFLWLGGAATLLAYTVLAAFSHVERRILSNRYADFAVSFDGRVLDMAALQRTIREFPAEISDIRYGADGADGARHAVFGLRYKVQQVGSLSVPLTDRVASLPGVQSAEWRG